MPAAAPSLLCSQELGWHEGPCVWGAVWCTGCCELPAGCAQQPAQQRAAGLKNKPGSCQARDHQGPGRICTGKVRGCCPAASPGAGALRGLLCPYRGAG